MINMSIVVKTEAYETTGKLTQEKQNEQIYEVITELHKELGRGANFKELHKRANEKFNPENIRYSKTQIAKNLFELKIDEKTEEEYQVFGNSQFLLTSPKE